MELTNKGNLLNQFVNSKKNENEKKFYNSTSISDVDKFSNSSNQ